ncbi:NPP1-like protein [Phytophthora infestans T30-4]|uniref:NPP1-like protein n=1 Tax=Phytophthora infestans (strain T30-4) TaxID=403677 RepID=D0N0S6_PHYIT|nr:NPP1-like protein [Phytophthora infestans T30-4]EEY67239.1 NPP1-like protein [Phytophthora infestans T30-4]|eukprot:XP_002905887.1 NPP1-like protein [Phytophthora infestans T30-4]
MNLRAFLIAAVASITVANAKVSRVNHDEVQPFAQPLPITDSQKSAVKYKPQLHISYGCHPYPAVEPNSYASGGLEWPGPADGDCTGSPLGSQVYSRSDWYKNKWAIMYAWYFPKGRYGLTGHRHYWEYVVVWTDTPTSTNSSIQGVSMSAGVGHAKATPPMLKYIHGSSIKLDSYFSFLGSKAALQLTKETGEIQDLITWDQMTVSARYTLNSDALDGNVWLTNIDEVPFKDTIFLKRLANAFPF